MNKAFQDRWDKAVIFGTIYLVVAIILFALRTKFSVDVICIIVFMILKSWLDTRINMELIIAFFKNVEGDESISTEGNNVTYLKEVRDEVKKKLEKSKQKIVK